MKTLPQDQHLRQPLPLLLHITVQGTLVAVTALQQNLLSLEEELPQKLEQMQQPLLQLHLSQLHHKVEQQWILKWIQITILLLLILLLAVLIKQEHHLQPIQQGLLKMGRLLTLISSACREEHLPQATWLH